jgi:cysteine desulfuration protein SufE
MDDALPLPPSIQRVLDRFRVLSREDKMQALVMHAKKLEPLPERFRKLDRSAFTVPECQTRVDLFPEVRDGLLYFYADVNTRQSPTIAAFLSILHPPETTLASPEDFTRVVMENIGLGTREVGLTAMVERLKRHALEAKRNGTRA